MSEATEKAASTNDVGTVQTPTAPAAYSPPGATTLGGLEQVLAKGYGFYYDGPHTTWLRF